jgi:hypothetical protein
VRRNNVLGQSTLVPPTAVLAVALVLEERREVASVEVDHYFEQNIICC